MHVVISLLTLFGLGFIHGLGPDHCLAIGSLAGGGGNAPLGRAARVSLRFGVSHSIVLAVCAGAAILLGFVIPESWEGALEVAGGIALLGMGVWTIFSARDFRIHRHEHVHEKTPHAHPRRSHRLERKHSHSHLHAHIGRDHSHEDHPALSAVAGAFFALSGVRGLTLLLPVALAQKPSLAIAGVVLFGLGVVSSMLLFGAAAALAVRFAGAWERSLRAVIGMASVACGAFWIVSHA